MALPLTRSDHICPNLLPQYRVWIPCHFSTRLTCFGCAQYVEVTAHSLCIPWQDLYEGVLPCDPLASHQPSIIYDRLLPLCIMVIDDSLSLKKPRLAPATAHQDLITNLLAYLTVPVVSEKVAFPISCMPSRGSE